MIPGLPFKEEATSGRLIAERLGASETSGIPTGVTHPDRNSSSNPKKITAASGTVINSPYWRASLTSMHVPVYIKKNLIILNIISTKNSSNRLSLSVQICYAIKSRRQLI